RARLEEVRQRLQKQKEQAEQARANLVGYARQKAAETRQAVVSLKERREVAKLNGRADRAERYAADALVCAADALDEAEEAILEAAVARIDADVAQLPAPAGR